MFANLLSALVASASETPIPDDVAIDILSTQFKGAVPCVSVSGKDPSPHVLSAIQQVRTDAVPASSCYYDGPDNHHMKAKAGPDSPAEFLNLSNFNSASPDKGSLQIFHRAGSWEGYGSVVDVERKNGHWQVTETVSRIVE